MIAENLALVVTSSQSLANPAVLQYVYTADGQICQIASYAPASTTTQIIEGPPPPPPGVGPPPFPNIPPLPTAPPSLPSQAPPVYGAPAGNVVQVPQPTHISSFNQVCRNVNPLSFQTSAPDNIHSVYDACSTVTNPTLQQPRHVLSMVPQDSQHVPVNNQPIPPFQQQIFRPKSFPIQQGPPPPPPGFTAVSSANPRPRPRHPSSFSQQWKPAADHVKASTNKTMDAAKVKVPCQSGGPDAKSDDFVSSE